MDQLTNKLQPQNIEAEQSLLGSILIDKNAILKISDLIGQDDFYKDTHGIIYETMFELYNKQEPIDLLSLANRLKEKGKLDKIGGRTYLVDLTNSVPTASHVITYAKIIKKKATLRSLISASAEIHEAAFNESMETDEVLDIAESKIFAVSQNNVKKQFHAMQDILSSAFDRIDEIHRDKGKVKGISTGFKSLDNILAGFQKSDLIILASRPSIGKTSLALNFARHIAVKSKIPVAIFSLEMSKEQLVDRMLSMESQVDSWRMRTGNLTDEDFPKIGHAMGVLSEAPIFIDDTSACNVMDLRTKARRLEMEHNLGLIIIDYLQLMEGRRASEGRTQEVSEISRKLKGVARELNVPILALSQLNRSVENRTPPIPKLADLRESGSIEQDADVVMFIYREDKYKTDGTPPTNIADIIIAKHRNGPVGRAQLYFEETRTQFRDLDTTVSKIGQDPSF